ncbi:hypothetical protein DY138_02560 [Apilactobacillus timberlakei]|uniref:hypothetical protein n=1 Tax=Apilactobacillus timberlakei TaxID=2008380 RepID=UPI00112B9DFD|nr:hypothetical protein [Apilactobacillus timberlakei]TPR19543.1 hypothetical protein DY138_02560 [Apilactobacillus timberlakei]TPR20520.1 hypothetical protein DY061_04200 [Apilactobacillus timberlakei]TPR22564.1 hypothetical protein DY083_03470 [Apilactobacillus timberlakei]
MKKNLLALLAITFLAFVSIYNNNSNALATSKQQSIVKKISAGKDENFNYYEILKKDGSVNFVSEVNAKYPKTHLLPFIKDHNTGLNIKQKINNDGTIHVKYEGTAVLKANFTNAVSAWNKLGIIKFKIVGNDDSSASVIVNGNVNSKEDDANSDYSKDSLGDTNNYVDYDSSAYLSDGTKVNYISKSDIVLYSGIAKLSDNNKNHVIIHELGHALGFDDLYGQNDRGLIMFSTSSVGSKLLNNLGACEKISLQHYYE